MTFCAPQKKGMIDMTKLKQIRKKARLTQQEFADKVGVSIKTIQVYEQNARDLKGASWIVVHKMAEVLECREVDLIE